MQDKVFDLLVVGGGINGVGIARDAAGQGVSVCLAEKGDLAGATSSASSKLIHGGLRYLEYREFRLVREALREREVLLRIAPHLVWPLRFVLPHDASQRPAWMIRLGLFLYDHLGGRERLPASRGLDLAKRPEGAPLKAEYRRGFEYADCWADDARLVVANALDAHAKGADIRTRTAVVSARRAEGVSEARLARNGATETIRARALVNATGPWATALFDRLDGAATRYRLALVQGSHIVVPRLYEGDQAYILQNTDKRIIFLLPFLDRFTVVGTTDTPYAGDPEQVAITAGEIDYLVMAANRFLRRPIGREEIVWSYSGVRPLYDDGSINASAMTRDYAFDIDAAEGAAPLLTIYGGKLTTYRKLAQHALRKILPRLGREPRKWTSGAPLPGGDMPGADFTAFLRALVAEYPFLPADLVRRYARLYGTRARALLKDVRTAADLGENFAAGLTACEVDFLRRTEWAETADDILWRRTKLGLSMTEAERRAVAEHLARRR
ncbi:MAG: glycerol-3-phosphate dehydrogenase [Rhodospirillaceae bacterium]|nr:glycerol-3-phosphate dehydrogenase [Rhodospirillaceae bacterium]